MKRLLLIVLLLAAGLPLRAERVDKNRAREAAQAFFQNDRNYARRMAPVEAVELSRAPLTKAGDDSPAYHIFNRAGGGFVIISGEDDCRPVLAYSFDESFGTGADMPENLVDWLEELEQQVAFVRAGAVDKRAAKASWDALFVRTKAGGDFQPAVKHVTPVWKQTAPFNGLTPVVGDAHAVIGCVPLAMGMIMRYYGFPPRGEGKLESYSYDLDNGSKCTIEGFDLGHPYEWDKIKFDYRDGYTQEEGEAVARLVYDCGVAVQAKFDESTSASTPKMAGCAVEYFGFDPGAYHYKRDLFGDEQWLDMLKAELQERPILYSARRETGGHAFLVDGYDEQGNVSVNWGWGGSSNGYYALSAFTPTESRKYLYSHGAIFGLKPKEGDGGQSLEYLYFQGGTSSSSGTVYNGIECDETIVPHTSFKIRAGFLYNGSLRPFIGEYAIVLCDAEGQIKEFVSNVNTFNELSAGSGRGYPSISCFMQSYPLPGDRLCLVYRAQDWPDGVWEKPIFDPKAGLSTEIPVTDGTKLDEVTSFQFNKTSGEIIIETKDLVDWSLKDASGAAIKDCVTYEMTAMKIVTTDLKKGNYTLTFKRFDEQLTLTLKMGMK